MSRGAGRVMRGIVETLKRYGKASTGELSAALFPLGGEAADVSTRRAARRLEALGVVRCLGFNFSEERVYCLPEQWDTLACLFAEGIGAEMFEQLHGWRGKRWRAGFVRLWNGSRLGLTAEQIAAQNMVTPRREGCPGCSGISGP